jgi:hypothetical protein
MPADLGRPCTEGPFSGGDVNTIPSKAKCLLDERERAWSLMDRLRPKMYYPKACEDKSWCLVDFIVTVATSSPRPVSPRDATSLSTLGHEQSHMMQATFLLRRGNVPHFLLRLKYLGA